MRYADTWGLRGHIFDTHPIKLRPEPESHRRSGVSICAVGKRPEVDSAGAEIPVGGFPLPKGTSYGRTPPLEGGFAARSFRGARFTRFQSSEYQRSETP